MADVCKLNINGVIYDIKDSVARAIIETLQNEGYLRSADVIDSLVSTNSTAPLSANQGRQLNINKIDNISINENILTFYANGTSKGTITLPTQSSNGGLTAEQATQLLTAYTHSQSSHAPSNAEQNVQADWNVTDSTNDSFIKNKPTIPSIEGLATENFVTNKIAEAQLNGGNNEVDLSGYATKDELNTKVDKVNGKGLSTNDLTNMMVENYNLAYRHSQSQHAPYTAEANVQADWNETDENSDAYIKNKPTNLATTNQIPTVPTKTSELTNDSNFVNETYVTNAINNAQLGGSGQEVDLSIYQTKTDNTLNTIDKTVVGAINVINEAMVIVEEQIGDITVGEVPVGGSNDAKDISITDTGNYFTSTNVEEALQEVGSQIKENESYNILKYSKLYDNINQDWSTAIQTCLNENSICYLPKGNYNIKNSIVLKTGNKLYGAGGRKTIITLQSDSLPIVTMGGTLERIENLTLKRESDTITSTGVGILIRDEFLGQSILSNIEIVNNYIGIYCPSTTNFYSNTLTTIWIQGYDYSAIYLEGYGGTGNCLKNVYTTNWDNYENKTKRSANFALYLANYNEMDISQINIEHAKLRTAIYVNNCDSVNFNTIHIEGIESTDSTRGVITALKSNVQINTLSMVYSSPSYNSNGYDIDTWNLLTQDTKGYMNINFIFLSNNYKQNGKVLPNGKATYHNIALALNNPKDDSLKLYIKEIIDKDEHFKHTSSYVYLNGGRKHQISRLKDNYYYRNISTNIVETYLPSLPDSGKWNEGDRIIITQPKAGEYNGYVCVANGDFSTSDTGTVGTTTPWQSSIQVSNHNLKTGDRFIVEGSDSTIYTATSNTYKNGSILQINITPVFKDYTLSEAVIKYAEPSFKGFGLIES